MLDGVLISGIAVTTGGVKVNHLLSRQPLGWMVMDKTAAGDVYRTAWDALSITLKASSNTTINMWVF